MSLGIPLTRRSYLLGAGTGLLGCTVPPRRIFYANSYHRGYGSSDEVARGIQETLAGHPLTMETYYLDGKRNPSGLPRAAEFAWQQIREQQPDVILVSDDDAMEHLVVPYLREGPTPVLFCGVNWSAEVYGVPNRFVSGMIEVLPVEETIRVILSANPEAKEIFILAEDSATERKNRTFLDPVYWRNGLSTTYGLVPDFDHWKKAFRWGNAHADLIYFANFAGIRDWNQDEALAHIEKWIRIPVFTCDEHMMPFAVLGRVKVAREQGEWVAQQALRVLDGASPAEIPLTRNQQSRLLTNPGLAALINFPIPAAEA